MSLHLNLSTIHPTVKTVGFLVDFLVKISSPTEIVSGSITLYYPSGEIKTIEYKPNSNITFKLQVEGEYWISASIKTSVGEMVGYYIISYGNTSREPTPLTTFTEDSVMHRLSYMVLNTIFTTLAIIIASIILYALTRKRGNPLGKLI